MGLLTEASLMNYKGDQLPFEEWGSTVGNQLLF
jgi:hypothetical protein